MDPGIFREYDIRGVAETELTDDVARKIGQGFAALVKESGGTTVALAGTFGPALRGFATASARASARPGSTWSITGSFPRPSCISP